MAEHNDNQVVSRRHVLSGAAASAVGLAVSGLPRLPARAQTSGAVASAVASSITSPGPAPAGPWDAFNYSPTSRTVLPVAVFTTSGTVQNPSAVLSGSPTSIVGNGSSVTLDFGKEVGGFVSLHFGSNTSSYPAVGLTFSESSLDVSVQHSDNSNGLTNIEPVITHFAPSGGTISTSAGDWGGAGSSDPGSQLRGGFRYLTVVNQGTGSLVVDQVSVDFTPAPGMTNPQAYANYFYSSDALLNRIWYAGAYTVQMDTVSAAQGRANPVPPTGNPPLIGWDNTALIGTSGTTVLIDGAKRDRTVWPGDMGMSIPTDLASLGDWQTVRDSLQLMYDLEQPTGQLPYSGPVLNFYGSDAYHLWTLINTALYFKITKDRGWLDSIWVKYKLAVAFVTSKIGADHLFNGTGRGDWARTDAGGENIELQGLCYRALTQGAGLASVESHTDPQASGLAAAWAQRAADLKSAVNAPGTGPDGTGAYWDPSMNLYRDETSGSGASLYPQDGNSVAAWYGLASPEQAHAISQALTGRWTKIGAITPEKSSASIHPFPGSMEVQAHFAANDDQLGLDLIRAEWGYMLTAPQGTASTFWEGYKTDGSSDYTDTGPGFRAGSYMSMAHGWSTGPTSALTFYVLGIAPGPADEDIYDLIPHPGNFTHVEGQLVTSLGVIRQSWNHDAEAGKFTQDFTAPAGAVGVVGVPTFGQSVRVRVDGKLAWNGKNAIAYDARTDGTYVYLQGIPGGSHEVSVSTG